MCLLLSNLVQLTIFIKIRMDKKCTLRRSYFPNGWGAILTTMPLKWILTNLEKMSQRDEQHRSVCLICGYMSQSTTTVMSRRSVNPTTLFLDRLPKLLTSTKCTSFHQLLTTSLLESVVGREWHREKCLKIPVTAW